MLKTNFEKADGLAISVTLNLNKILHVSTACCAEYFVKYLGKMWNKRNFLEITI